MIGKPVHVIGIGEGDVSTQIRTFAALKLLSQDERYKIEILDSSKTKGMVKVVPCDVAVVSRPLNMELINALRQVGAMIVVDQDDDFAAIPQTHVGYKAIGKGKPEVLREHLECLRSADVLVVSTPELKERFSTLNSRIVVIPNGWDDTNPEWSRVRPTYMKGSVVGWGGTITHREDFKLVLPALERIAKLHEDVSVWIAGDPEIFKMLRFLPEQRKLFFPTMAYEKYPLFIRLLDVLLVPLKDDYFNRGKSDIKLVDSGAAGVPYIASPLPQYTSWPGGGIIADGTDAWYTAIMTLANNPDIRTQLGNIGRTHAIARTFRNLSIKWKQAIGMALALRSDNEDRLRLQRQQGRMELQRVAGNDPPSGNQESG